MYVLRYDSTGHKQVHDALPNRYITLTHVYTHPMVVEEGKDAILVVAKQQTAS